MSKDFLTGRTCLSRLTQGSSLLALVAAAVFLKLMRMCFKSVTMFEDVEAVEISSGSETSNLEVVWKRCNKDFLSQGFS